MRHSPARLRVAAIVVLVLGLAALSLAASASADPGQSQTFHFNTLVDQLGAPTAPTTNVSNCPAPVLNDFTEINATGNGVTHQTVNGAGDFWATTTFTGNATVSFWSQGAFDQGGNVISVGGNEGMQVTGHITDWFGISGNRNNAVSTGTVNFQGTVVGTGAPISFHNVVHFVYIPGADESGPPSFFFNVASCN